MIDHADLAAREALSYLQGAGRAPMRADAFRAAVSGAIAAEMIAQGVEPHEADRGVVLAAEAAIQALNDAGQPPSDPKGAKRTLVAALEGILSGVVLATVPGPTPPAAAPPAAPEPPAEGPGFVIVGYGGVVVRWGRGAPKPQPDDPPNARGRPASDALLAALEAAGDFTTVVVEYKPDAGPGGAALAVLPEEMDDA